MAGTIHLIGCPFVRSHFYFIKTHIEMSDVDMDYYSERQYFKILSGMLCCPFLCLKWWHSLQTSKLATRALKRNLVFRMLVTVQ